MNNVKQKKINLKIINIGKKSIARMERNVKMKVRDKVVCEGSRSRKYSRLGYNEHIKTFAQYGGVKTVSGICHFVDMNVWD